MRRTWSRSTAEFRVDADGEARVQAVQLLQASRAALAGTWVGESRGRTTHRCSSAWLATGASPADKRTWPHHTGSAGRLPRTPQWPSPRFETARVENKRRRNHKRHPAHRRLRTTPLARAPVRIPHEDLPKAALAEASTREFWDAHKNARG